MSAQGAAAPGSSSAPSLGEQLVAAGPCVRRYLFGMCGDWHEAEDLAQEAIFRAWAGRKSFDGRSQVQTWVLAIARNAWLDRLRQRRARPQRVEMNEHSPTLQSASPPAAAGQAELVAALSAAIQTLPDEQREALALRESGGLSFQQMGEVLGVPVSTAKSRVRYALLKLADRLKRFQRELEA